MTNILRLNLPAPSESMIQLAKDFASSFDFDADRKRWLDEFHSGSVNSAIHHFDRTGILTPQLKEQYQEYFPHHKIGSSIGIMKNGQDIPACMPPHVDRARAVGINYFVELGGKSVTTVFYDRTETVTDKGYNIEYNKLVPVQHYVAEYGRWYAYNVSRYHSVENLEGTRIFISIKLFRPHIVNDMDFEYGMQDFLCDYSNLVAEHIH
jgi:hypothetical protein